MQKIISHLWFDKEAIEAATFYTSLFPESRIANISTIKDTPSGDCDTVQFVLAGQKFAAISAGPYFKLNPSISLFTVFNNEEDILQTWSKLAEGGSVLMPLDTYPWAKKYGWVQDRFGVSWQLSFSEFHELRQRITPMLMFTNAVAGKTTEAIEFYTSIFHNSSTDMLVKYDENDDDTPGNIKHSRFTLHNCQFMAMDSGAAHAFTFNEAFSFMVMCDDQQEIDFFTDKLSAVKEAEQCGWVKDKYGVSWQITPRHMDELMKRETPEQTQEVVQAMLQMKRLNIEELRNVGR